MPEVQMKTIAFVTRIHPKRPRMLQICVDSIKAQTSNDYIHILHRDDETKNGYGLFLANQSFTKVSPIDAQYVMVLDDDDMLVDLNFVKRFRKIVKKYNPEIVFFKGKIVGKKTLPKKQHWDGKPRRSWIASFCFAVKLDVWKKYIHLWGEKKCGDYYFISACYKGTKNHFWFDRSIARTQKRAGHSKGEDDHD